MRAAELLLGLSCAAAVVWMVRPAPAPSDVATAKDRVVARDRVVGRERVATPSVPARAQEVRVVRHTDGDTLHVVADRRGQAVPEAHVDTTVRLLEIDAPESVDPRSPTQCFSREAGRRLAELLPVGSRAWVLPDTDLLDPYSRTLLYVWNEDGAFVNLTMVREGMAKAVLYEPNDAHIDLMRQAERGARARGKGLWSACDYFGEPAGE